MHVTVSSLASPRSTIDPRLAMTVTVATSGLGELPREVDGSIRGTAKTRREHID